MSIIHIVGCPTEDKAKTEAIAYQLLKLHTIVVGPADTLHISPASGAETWPQNFGSWIMIATDGAIESVTMPSSSN